MTELTLLSIGAAAQEAGCCVSTVKHYEMRGLISPLRDNNGRRLFTPSDVKRLADIRRENAGTTRFTKA